jgi:hypothetical protein
VITANSGCLPGRPVGVVVSAWQPTSKSTGKKLSRIPGTGQALRMRLAAEPDHTRCDFRSAGRTSLVKCVGDLVYQVAAKWGDGWISERGECKYFGCVPRGGD